MNLALIQERIGVVVPDARLEIIANPPVEEQTSVRVDRAHLYEVARCLRDDPELCFDLVSNVTGVDWPEEVVREKVTVRRVVDGVEKEFEDVIEIKRSGRLEVVYHLYSTALKHGPLVLRARTENRSDHVTLPSLTPLWRSCELQEREVYDLFGVVFAGHPDLRRLLMWPEFQDHPMRKDYVDPDDYEYEPTPHGEVLKRAEVQAAGAQGGSTP